MLDYRKFTGSRDLRQRILSILSWVPDKFMLRIQYFLQTGKWLHLKNPKIFQEYIQAYKLWYRNPDMPQCVDKGTVRDFVRSRGLEKILIPLEGIYNSVEEIDFDTLPDKFVMKTTDGGGNNEVLICRDKNRNKDTIKKKAAKWMAEPKPRKHIGREWAYDNGFPRKIIIEGLLEDPSGNPDIDDFKFFCYNGKFKVLEWHKDRSRGHRAALLDESLNFQKEVEIYPVPFGDEKLPGNIKEMIKTAEILAKGFPFVRVDLYNVGGEIYFGEMTFYPASGYFVYKPEEVNEWLGSFFKYPFTS